MTGRDLLNKTMFNRFDRRIFLRTVVTGGALALSGRGNLSWSADADASLLVSGKDSRLIVHNTKTLELETPLEVLREYAVTPKKVLFVRSNQELADTRTVKPPGASDWQFEVVGMVENPRTADLKQLRRMEQTEVEMVLQC
ncbi:MAG TPA: molybdopterin-dependent oxidoreductase, partial [Pirellulales bacterium]|nr:molybdopterin-dependent oxidoreductase [Pirellulales bacterium]